MTRVRPQVAVVTRTTPDYIWFVLAQDAGRVEHFADRNRASPSVGVELIVEQLEPGIWFISDPTSLAYS